MKPTKYLIDNEDIDIFFHNGRCWFFEDSEGDCFVVPAVGDVVEYENGERTIVVYSSVDLDDEGLSMTVDMLKKKTSFVLNKKGRQRKIVEVMDDDAVWPMENVVLKRDGIQIYPVTLKYRFINKCVTNKFFIKKYIHLKYAELKMNYKRIINECNLFKNKLIKKFYEYKEIVAQKFKIK
tara:strand:+ start:225 stop:764 length:540 start_codon:yes stop_codon:yes gene_type:complete